MTTPSGRRAALAAAAVLSLGILPLAPAADAAAPAAPLPATDGRTAPGARGDIVAARPLTSAAALPSAARNLAVTYTSEGVHGNAIDVTGTVALPATPPPPGGWPVISWAHGTTGTADVCAPSRDTADGPAHDYLAGVDQTLDRWVARGFVVVRTDYEGLGTPGEHPYINGRSAADTVVDIVRAARRLDPRVGRGWVAMGHSQGGHAALFAAASAAKARDLDLLGAVAIAPGGVFLDQTAPYIKSGGPGAQAALAFLPTLLIGAAAADPAVDPDALLTDAGQPLLDAGRTGCLADTRRAAEGMDPTTVFEPDADLTALTEYLRSQDPVSLTLQVPTLVAQGTTDTLVSKPGTDFLVHKLCQAAPLVTYRAYDGADHRAVVPASLRDAESFVDQLLAGRQPGTTC